MLWTTVHMIGGLLALLAGGEMLVRGSVGLARHWNVPPLLIGLTIVSIGTSAPELTVSLMAALEGHTAIVLGNVVGSNICNIGLILGLVALIRPLSIERRLVVREVPILLAVTLIAVAMLGDGQLVAWEGVVLLVGLLVYLALGFRGGNRMDVKEGALPAATLQAYPSRSIVLVVVGVAGLYFGGEWLVAGAVELATAMGISQAVISVTIIAIGTSLPELVASLVALRSGEADLAVGNVVGSNLFNLMGILGLNATLFGVAMIDLGWADLGVMVGMTLVLYPMIVSARRLERWEGSALLAAYLAYLGWLALG